MGLGFSFPTRSRPLREQAGLAAELAELGYDDVWTSEAQGQEAFTGLVCASQWAPSLRLGTACIPVQTRGPGLLADTIAALCDLAPGRVVIGLGSSSEFVVTRHNARPFGKPLAHVRDMLRFLRAALTGERVREQYETFRVDYKLDRPPEQPPKILVAALRPKMIELGAREADGVILNHIAPEDVPALAKLVHEHGRDKEIAARIQLTPVDDVQRAREHSRASIAAYYNVPTYRAEQEWLGHSALYQPMWDAWAEGGFKAAMAAVSDPMVDRTFIAGPADFCRQRLQDYRDAGVDTPIIATAEDCVSIDEAARLLAPR